MFGQEHGFKPAFFSRTRQDVGRDRVLGREHQDAEVGHGVSRFALEEI
jgi:hypothetical protein